MGLCNSCLNDLGVTSLQAKPPRKKVRPLLADLQADFEKYAGADEVLDVDELANIWKAAAVRQLGKLSDDDVILIETSCQAYFKSMDADRCGKVSYEEFVTFMMGEHRVADPCEDMRRQLNAELRRNPSKMRQLIDEFKRWDKNGDGVVSPEELEQHLRELEKLGGATARADALKLGKMKEKIFEEADVDHDGKLDLWEVMAHCLGRRRSPVEVLVYDVSKGMADKLGPVLLGKNVQAVHSGVLVYGSEYWYGGKVFRSNPPCTQCFGTPLDSPWGEPLQPSEYRPDLKVVRVGYTFVTHDEFAKWLSESVVERYTGLEKYDLLTHSCNHFSNEVVTFLTGSELPDKILELQKTFSTPALLALRPFLNRYMGGFGEADKDVDENLFTKDEVVAASSVDVAGAVLGQGDVVMVSGIEGSEGVEIVATVVSEKEGVCDIKYFDPIHGKVTTRSGVSRASLKTVADKRIV